MNRKVIGTLIIALVVVAVGSLLFIKVFKPRSNNQNLPQGVTALPQESKVTLTDSGFSPATITIKAGTSVRWENKSSGNATVNSDDHPTHQKYKPLNLGEFAPGSTVTLIFNTPGTYTYHDHLHPDRRGTVVVQ